MPAQIPAFIRNRLESERLILRVPVPGDGRMVHQAVSDSFPELHRWMDWARTLPTVSDSEGFAREMARLVSAREEIAYLITRRTDGHMVGAIGVHHIDWAVPRFEIGYWARTSDSGQGYITEAARTVLAYLFEVLHAERVEIRCDARNGRSAAVAERLGFTLEGRLRHERRDTDGTLSDSLLFAMLREEWRT